MTLQIAYVEGVELPWRVTVSRQSGLVYGAGATLSAAGLAAFSVGFGFRGSAAELAAALFMTTKGGGNWARLIGALERKE